MVSSPSGVSWKPGFRVVSTGCDPRLYRYDERRTVKSTRWINSFLRQDNVDVEANQIYFETKFTKNLLASIRTPLLVANIVFHLFNWRI
jgi:hypothetical protein